MSTTSASPAPAHSRPAPAAPAWFGFSRGAVGGRLQRLATRADLIAIVALGLVVRLLILPAPGNTSDIVGLIRFGSQVATHGPHSLYDPPDLSNFDNNFNYPPLFPYLLAATFWVRAALLSPAVLGTGATDRVAPDFAAGATLVKLWGAAADLAIGVLIYRHVRRVAGAGWARTASLAFLCSPGVLYNSAWWGQVDSLFTYCVLMALLGLSHRRVSGAWMWLAAAVLVKPQSLMAGPIVAVSTLRFLGVRAAGRGALAGAALAAVCTSPFWLTGRLDKLVAVYAHATDAYPRVSVNAFNMWWAGGGPGGGELVWYQDTRALIGDVTYRQVGLVLLLGYVGLILWKLWRSRDATASPWLPAAGAACFAFFMLPTQIHERYLFPTLPLLCLLLHRHPLVPLAYAVLSVTFVANLVHVVPWTPGAVEVLDAVGLTSQRIALANVLTLSLVTLLVLGPTGYGRSDPADQPDDRRARFAAWRGPLRAASAALALGLIALDLAIQIGPTAPQWYRPLPSDPLLVSLAALVLAALLGSAYIAARQLGARRGSKARWWRPRYVTRASPGGVIDRPVVVE